MGGLHITEIDALEDFARQFADTCNRLQLSVSEIHDAVADSQRWLSLCKEEAGREVASAISVVEDCETDVDDCLAQEDEDYIPDCSGEEASLQEAEELLEMWRFRYRRIMELTETFEERKQFLLERANPFTSSLVQRRARGLRYLKEQIGRMNKLLKEKGAKS